MWWIGRDAATWRPVLWPDASAEKIEDRPTLYALPDYRNHVRDCDDKTSIIVSMSTSPCAALAAGPFPDNGSPDPIETPVAQRQWTSGSSSIRRPPRAADKGVLEKLSQKQSHSKSGFFPKAVL